MKLASQNGNQPVFKSPTHSASSSASTYSPCPESSCIKGVDTGSPIHANIACIGEN